MKASAFDSTRRRAWRTGTLRTLAAGVGAAIAVAGGCAPPSRHLTPRVVEDPLVLPRKMASAALGGGLSHREPSGTLNRWSEGSIRLGLTDRLEWTDILSLRYGLLDDRPADGRPAHPLSLALQAGFRGIGYSSGLGVIAYPTAAVQTLKRVGDRWALALSMSWLATWVQRPVGTFRYSDELSYSNGRRSYWTLNAGATRQLTERFALSLASWFQHAGACVSPTCPWIARSAGGSLHLNFRPWRWLTVAAGPHVGVRTRPDIPDPPGDPTQPAPPMPPHQVYWVGLSGRVAVHW